MKISDLLSPTDVMIDVRAQQARWLLQTFAPKPLIVSACLSIRSRPTFSSRRTRIDRDRPGRRHSACPAAGICGEPHGLLCEIEAADRIDANDGQRLISCLFSCAAAVRKCQLSALALVARTLRPPENLAAIAERKEFIRALFGDRLTIGLTAIRRAGIASTARARYQDHAYNGDITIFPLQFRHVLEVHAVDSGDRSRDRDDGKP